jgi:hypothetical protein
MIMPEQMRTPLGFAPPTFLERIIRSGNVVEAAYWVTALDELRRATLTGQLTAVEEVMASIARSGRAAEAHELLDCINREAAAMAYAIGIVSVVGVSTRGFRL